MSDELMNTNKIHVDVNQFPSLTWNFLNINRTHLETEIAKEAEFSVSASDDLLNIAEVSNSDLPDLVKNIETGLGKEFDKAFDNFCTVSDTSLFEVSSTAGGPRVFNIDLWLDNNETKAKDFIIQGEEGTDSVFIFTFKSEEEVSGTLGARIRVYAGDNASVKICLVNLLGKDAVHFVSTGSYVCDNAFVEVNEINLGGKKVYYGNHQELAGYKAKCSGHTAYLVNKDSQLDMNYVSNQTGRETESFMAVDGICEDNTVKTWRGTINFVKGCVESKGDEQENVLLLSPKVINKTLPVILCDEEAVEGRHGASIGKLGKEILFYMQSRGVDEKEAQRLMILAKINSTCRFIPDEKVTADINDFLNKRFGE